MYLVYETQIGFTYHQKLISFNRKRPVQKTDQKAENKRLCSAQAKLKHLKYNSFLMFGGHNRRQSRKIVRARGAGGFL